MCGVGKDEWTIGQKADQLKDLTDVGTWYEWYIYDQIHYKTSKIFCIESGLLTSNVLGCSPSIISLLLPTLTENLHLHITRALAILIWCD